MHSVFRFGLSILAAVSVLVGSAMPVFALNPNTGDNFNLPLVLGIGGGALVILIIVLAFTGKKGKGKNGAKEQPKKK